MKKIFYLSLSLFFIFTSCNKNKETDPPTCNLSQGDFTDAQILMVTDEPNNYLYKFSSTNTVEKVTFNCDVNLVDLTKGTPEYMFFSTYHLGTYNAYLLNRNTFALTSISKFGIPSEGQGITSVMDPLTKCDGNSNLYYGAYINNNYNLVRLNLSNPSTITSSVLLPDTAELLQFNIDKYGNAITLFIGKHGMYTHNRIVKTNGDLYDYNSPTPNSMFWIDTDSSFSFYDLVGYNINKIIYNSNSQDFSVNPFMPNVTKFYNPHDSYRIIYNNKMIWVDNEIYEWTAASTAPTKITSIPFYTIKLMDHTQSNGYLYLVNKDASAQETIFKIDLSNYSYTTISTPGSYTFNCIETMNDGTIYASATRVIDGKNVFLKFSPTGVETLLDETLNQKAKYMLKVKEY